MKPTPLTSAQLLAAGYNSGDPEGLIEFAQGVSDARDAQWGQMLAEQEPVGYAVPTFDFDNSVIKKAHYARTVPLYAQPKPKAEPINQQLLEALKELVEEKCDYMIRNNLGNPETEHTTKMARAAIAAAEGVTHD